MEMLSNQTDLEFIADTIPYFPFHGVDRFYDISGLVANPAAFQVQTLSLLNISPMLCFSSVALIYLSKDIKEQVLTLLLDLMQEVSSLGHLSLLL
jgi:hypothetical protein